MMLQPQKFGEARNLGTTNRRLVFCSGIQETIHWQELKSDLQKCQFWNLTKLKVKGERFVLLLMHLKTSNTR